MRKGLDVHMRHIIVS